MHFRAQLLLGFVFFVTSFAYGKHIVLVDDARPNPEKKALLIIPGFGSISHGVKHLRDYYANKGYDVYIPDYIGRKSVAQCTENLGEFIDEYDLKSYGELHVLSYLIGAWSFNEWLKTNQLANLKTIVYDRSPLQERAPYALAEDSPLLARLAGGKTIRDMSGILYPSFEHANGVKVGLMIETVPTKLILKRRETAASLGPLSWDLADLNQTYTDYIFIPFNHDDLYVEFDAAGQEVLYFFAHGAFSAQGSKEQPQHNPLVP